MDQELKLPENMLQRMIEGFLKVQSDRAAQAENWRKNGFDGLAYELERQNYNASRGFKIERG